MENTASKIHTDSVSITPQIVPIVSTKGGEGKSTQAGNLAGFLADSGLRTLLIDGDHSQPTASSIFSLQYEAPNGFMRFMNANFLSTSWPGKQVYKGLSRMR
jgi:chromosome partitioning related protein ParA